MLQIQIAGDSMALERLCPAPPVAPTVGQTDRSIAVTEATFKTRQAQRGKVLSLARGLARSGQHEDHRSIIAELLHPLEDFPDAYRCLTDRVISAQLDKLCAMAQASAQASPSALAAFLADMREGARS